MRCNTVWIWSLNKINTEICHTYMERVFSLTLWSPERIHRSYFWKLPKTVATYFYILRLDRIVSHWLDAGFLPESEIQILVLITNVLLFQNFQLHLSRLSRCAQNLTWVLRFCQLKTASKNKFTPNKYTLIPNLSLWRYEYQKYTLFYNCLHFYHRNAS